MNQDVKAFLEEVNENPETALRVMRNLYEDKIRLEYENKDLKKDLIEQNSDKLWPIYYERMLELEHEVNKWKELADDGEVRLRKAKNENTDLRIELKELKEENDSLQQELEYKNKIAKGFKEYLEKDVKRAISYFVTEIINEEKD